MVHDVLRTVLLILVLGAAYAGLLCWMAWEDFKRAPRTDFHICDKHGAFPSKYLLHTTMPQGDDWPICPMCYEDSMKIAAQRVREENRGID